MEIILPSVEERLKPLRKSRGLTQMEMGMLCGHAHGGQIRLPFIGGVYAPGQGFFPEYAEGKRVIGGTCLIISRGLGNSLFPFRINNPPELVKITLTCGNNT